MNYLKLRQINQLYFGYETIAKALGVTLESARVVANRYTKQGVLVRFKRNVYVFADKWANLNKEEKLVLANIGQVPSYISLLTALDYYEVTTQIQQDYIESVAVKRSKEMEVKKVSFRYAKISKELYFDFSRKKGVFIASPEKAFLDALYLASLNKYRFEISSIDMSKLNKQKIKKILQIFPKRTQTMVENNGYLEKA